MKNWILAAATLLLMNGMEAREHWGPPPLCPPAKTNGEAKAKCPPKPACPKPEVPACPVQPSPPSQLCPSDDSCCPAWPKPVLHAAYNYPAGIKTRCPYQLSFDLTFIYWQPSGDNLELGFTNKHNASASPFAANAPIDAKIIGMDFDFSPGFKIGVSGNFNHDNWDLHAAYTWFHNSHHESTSVSTVNPTKEIYATQGAPFSGNMTISYETGYSTNVFNAASGTWHLGMDLIDLDLGRCYYSGTKLLFRPSFGVRAAIIDQHYDLTYTNNGTLGLGFADTQKVSKKFDSWALGPMLALDTQWLLGYGIRIIGSTQADLLYTRYTNVAFKESHSVVTASNFSINGPVKVNDGKFGALRTHLDMELGLGWGMYFNCNKWYLDLAATYGYQIFFDELAFRKFVDDVNWFNSLQPTGNLYVQGLTFTTRFDF